MSIDIITYESEHGLPWYVEHCIENKILKGFNVLSLTPDKYDCKPCHASFKHFRDITMPKLKETNDKGIFFCEGDVMIDDGFDVKNIPQSDEPTWYGYKKILKNGKQMRYIVGNFLIWIPKTHYQIIKDELDKKKNRLLVSDRFFSQLVEKGILKLHEKSIADEITHFSHVIGNVRKGKYNFQL